MIKLFYGIEEKSSDLSFPEFMTWIRRLYKTTIQDSGYVLVIKVQIGANDV